MVTIDRSKPFDPAAFLYEGWSIDEQDERSLALTAVDLAAVRLEPMLRPGERRLVGEERLRRLKDAGHVRLDAQVLQALWEKQHLIPEHWKGQPGESARFIHFDGTVLRDPDGERNVLYLYWDGGESWGFTPVLLVCTQLGDPSAVLAG